jgi:preprotein translocase subunit SecG
MYQVIIVVHVLLGLGVIGFVLIQHGKGADAGAAFGSASSGTVFGAQGASSFLSRTTAVLAALFFATSLGLAILSGHQGSGEIDLMDAPEIEEGLADDVPVVNEGDAASKKGNPSTINEEVPSVLEDASKTINNTSEEVKAKIDTVDTKVQKAVKDTKVEVLDKVEKLDKK